MPQPVSTKPMYQKIRERLERDIAGGHYAAGQKFPSEAALVQRFGASRITVGRAVRELQERGLLDRVAGSGTYVRGAAQRPTEGLLFGLVIPNLGETEIFEPICQGIAASPEARGHGLLWAHADQGVEGRVEQALELAPYCLARSVAGVFFAPLEFSPASAEVNARVIKLLHGAGIAVVLLDRRPEDSPARRTCDLVGIDNHRAGFLAAGHLLRLGARRVGFVRLEGQASTVNARVRIPGCPGRFLRPRPRLHHAGQSAHGVARGRAGLRCLRLRQRPCGRPLDADAARARRAHSARRPHRGHRRCELRVAPARAADYRASAVPRNRRSGPARHAGAARPAQDGGARCAPRLHPGHPQIVRDEAGVGRPDAKQPPCPPDIMIFPMQIEKVYEPQRFEPHWAQWWIDSGIFRASPENPGRAFSLVIPPPNVTGILHIGHMLEHTEIDVTVRWHRMIGDNTLWLPGTDHAGIATQMVVARQLKEEGVN